MREPNEKVAGRIVDYDPEHRELVIRAPYDDWYMLSKRKYRDCEIRLIDGRPLSGRQRSMIYALLKEISDYTGTSASETKEILKRRFLDEELCEPGMENFSLSDCSMSTACAFQRWLVRFMLEYDVPSRCPLLEAVDDVPDYLYACAVNRKCCICGRESELHHCSGSAVGMGRNRREIVHEGAEVLPLCRIHHSECHDIGQISFNERYHLPGGVIMDRELCRLYNLKPENTQGGKTEC